MLVVAAIVAVIVEGACRADAGHVLFDVADRRLLDAVDADIPIPAGRVADLLLVGVLRERVASGEMSLSDRVTVLPVAGDRGPHLSAQEPVEVGELLQLLLLTDSRTATKTLAWATGPSIGRCLARMQQLATRLGLVRTSIPDDWPFAATRTTASGPKNRGATTARELGRLALAVVTDRELRRRVRLDGVPISNGGLIVRATDPLIATDSGGMPPASGPPTSEIRLALVERGGLELFAVAAGPRPQEELAATLERGFHRYRRVELVHEGQVVGPPVRVRGGIIPTFKAVAAEPWALTTTESAPPLAFRLQLPAEIAAPVDVRQPVGELVVEQEGRVIAVVPLVAPQAIAPSGWLDTAHRGAFP